MLVGFFLPILSNACTQFIGTVFLLLVVCAVNDKKNGPPPAGLVPLVLFITILGIGASLGFQTGKPVEFLCVPRLTQDPRHFRLRYQPGS